MYIITEEQTMWLTALLEEAVGRANTDEKKGKLLSLKEKVAHAFSFIPSINTTEQDVKDAKEILESLRRITETYTENPDLEAVDDYEYIKREMIGQLEYLSTIREKIVDDANFMKDYLRKELYSTLALEYTDPTDGSKGVSQAKADRLVEVDPRYLTVKKQYNRIQEVASMVKTRYEHYTRTLQAVIQSCSSARKFKSMQH